MAFSISYTLGATTITRTYNITNAKATAILTRYATHKGILQEGATLQEIGLALIDQHADDIVRGAREVQVADARASNEAAILAAAEADNAM